MAFDLPKLPYGYDALEPHFDARTMEIHHTKHHQTYTSNLNKAIENTSLANRSIEAILAGISDTRGQSTTLRNNAGGYFNHNLFWEILNPADKKGTEPTGELAEKINLAFNNFENFKTEFAKAAATRFGSGWAWLYVKEDKRLGICSTPNQDNPLMDMHNLGTPILGLDVWEHAYYLKYQNRRPEYINAFWDVVNWEAVSKKLKS